MAFDIQSAMLAVIHIFVAAVVSLFAVYCGMSIYMAKTKSINEWKEIAKKNTAIGIMLGSVIIAVAIVTGPAVSASLAMFDTLYLPALAVRFFVAIINAVAAAVIAAFSVYLSTRMIDKLTMEIDEVDELKKGNVAVAAYMGAAIIAMALLISPAVGTIISAVDLFSYVKSLGF